MKENLNKNVISILKEKYNELFEAEKKVAKFIIDKPYIAINCNVSELAEKSGVSDASVIRMCKHVDFNGYYQLRLALSMYIGSSIKPQEKKLEDIDAVYAIFKEYSNHMLEIGKSIDINTMKTCINLLNNCNFAHLIAVGNTVPLAQYMSFRLGRLGMRCTFGNSEEYWLNSINLAEKEDIIIAISQSGMSKAIIKGVELAKEKGIKTIAITGHLNSPLSNISDHILLSRDISTGFDYYKSYAHLRETAVIDALLYFLTNKEMIEAKGADKLEMLLAENKV